MELKKLNVLLHFQYKDGDKNRPYYNVTFMYSNNEESFKRIAECNNAVQVVAAKYLTHWRMCKDDKDYYHLFFHTGDKSMVYGAEVKYYDSWEYRLLFDTIRVFDDDSWFGEIDATKDNVYYAIHGVSGLEGKLFFKINDGEIFEIVPDEDGRLPETYTLIG